jgi:CBS domain-containing protein
MNLVKIAHVPPVAVGHQAMVADAVKAMVENGVGAVAIVEAGEIKGIFSERDVMKKVIYQNLAPDRTLVSDVMTKDVESIRSDMSSTEALRLMMDRHIRHLPIVDEQGMILGILSIRNLLHSLVEELEDSVNTITSYFNADGGGG